MSDSPTAKQILDFIVDNNLAHVQNFHGDTWLEWDDKAEAKLDEFLKGRVTSTGAPRASEIEMPTSLQCSCSVTGDINCPLHGWSIRRLS